MATRLSTWVAGSSSLYPSPFLTLSPTPEKARCAAPTEIGPHQGMAQPIGRLLVNAMIKIPTLAGDGFIHHGRMGSAKKPQISTLAVNVLRNLIQLTGKRNVVVVKPLEILPLGAHHPGRPGPAV